jgi:ubiquinone/menaquinone biosynthesis C-methylase UbiE
LRKLSLSFQAVQMKTKITTDNPHRYDRYGFAWQHVPHGSAAHLDFGCYKGSFLRSLDNKNITNRVGVDISRQAIDEAKLKHPDLATIHLNQTTPLPFSDKEFQSITLMDVLEHVYEQIELLKELRRVLRDDGILIVTVPGKHLFSCMDTGNLKFRFPRLHKWYYCKMHSRQEYEKRYSQNPDGLIGDVSAKKAWHEHFSQRQMKELLDKAGFTVREFDGNGYFCRPLSIINKFFGLIPPIHRAINRIIELDYKHFESSNLFCLAEKNSLNK